MLTIIKHTLPENFAKSNKLRNSIVCGSCYPSSEKLKTLGLGRLYDMWKSINIPKCQSLVLYTFCLQILQGQHKVVNHTMLPTILLACRNLKIQNPLFWCSCLNLIKDSQPEITQKKYNTQITMTSKNQIYFYKCSVPLSHIHYRFDWLFLLRNSFVVRIYFYKKY